MVATVVLGESARPSPASVSSQECVVRISTVMTDASVLKATASTRVQRLRVQEIKFVMRA